MTTSMLNTLRRIAALAVGVALLALVPGCTSDVGLQDAKPGVPCWDLNENGIADPEEDLVPDGAVDVLDCRGAPGENGEDGHDGEDGEPGPAGEAGAPGTACWDIDGNGFADREEDRNGDDVVDVLDCRGDACWDLDADGFRDASEDLNNDGVVDVLDCRGTEGPQGQTGETGAIGATGGPGTAGLDGIDCWDIDGNGFGTPAEDVNLDGVYDTLDCQGPEGIQGQQGNQGIQGVPGTAGVDCWDTDGNGVGNGAEDTNLDGLFDTLDCQGPQGIQGQQGNQGIQGVPGTAGIDCWDTDGNGVGNGAEDTNLDGLFDTLDCQGPQGIQGQQGIQGNQGIQGIQGMAGIDCWDTDGNGAGNGAEDTNLDGLFDTLDCQGPQGIQGQQGNQGNQGVPGQQGIPGVPGPPGPAGPSGGLTLTSSNLNSLGATAGDRVKVVGLIGLTSNYLGLDVDDLMVQGGGLTGTGSQTVTFGDRSVVVGMYFDDVMLSGTDVLFVNCDFTGTIRFPHGARVQGGSFANMIQNTQHKIGSVYGTEIDNSVVGRADEIAASTIDGSTIGSPSLNTHVYRIERNEISDSTVIPGTEAVVQANRFEDTFLQVVSSKFSSMTIVGNYFDGIATGETEIIQVDTSTSRFGAMVIAGNTFIVPTSAPRALRVQGNATGTYQTVQIQNNGFLKGSSAVSFTSNIRSVLSDNVTRSTPLGVSSTATRVLNDNVYFP